MTTLLAIAGALLVGLFTGAMLGYSAGRRATSTEIATLVEAAKWYTDRLPELSRPPSFPEDRDTTPPAPDRR